VIYSRKNTYKLYQLEKYAALTEAEAVFATTTEVEAVYLRSADAETEAEAVVATMTKDVEAAVRGGVALRWWEVRVGGLPPFSSCLTTLQYVVLFVALPILFIFILPVDCHFRIVLQI
jgi:hypothetical protein